MKLDTAMVKTINAHYWSATEEHGVLVLGFADDKHQPSQYLILQRTLEPTAQDRRLGQDAVHIEMNDQNNSAYGGIRRVELKQGKSVLLSLEPRTAEAIGSAEKLEILLNVDPTKASDLQKELQRVFAGQEIEIG